MDLLRPRGSAKWNAPPGPYVSPFAGKEPHVADARLAQAYVGIRNPTRVGVCRSKRTCMFHTASVVGRV